MIVLGISAYYHDSAAALVKDGVLVAAAQEERFTRIKHDPAFPINAIRYCLKEVGFTLDSVDFIVFYDKPFLKFERLLETYVGWAPRGFSSFRMAVPLWLREKLGQKKLILDNLEDSFGISYAKEKLLFSEHHISHAASAFYPSPFDEAVVLTMDGVGEWATTSVSVGSGNSLDIRKEVHFPHSIGLLYSAFTYYTGFKVNSGEYKLMGLAPYGSPVYADMIMEKLVDLKEDGSFRLDQRYFNYSVGLTMTNKRFHDLFGLPPRKPADNLTQKHMDIAASIQEATERIVLKLTDSLAEEYGIPNLCLAGGVALNCVANGKILRRGKFKKIWIQPASGDAGGALGAAFAAYYMHAKKPRTTVKPDSMRGSFLGPSYNQSEIEGALKTSNAKYKVYDMKSIVEKTAIDILNGKAVGWFQGRMEFGPRALGSRSIIGDTRSPNMQRTLNLKVKYRESFRPFAPSVLLDNVSEYFEIDTESPYMGLVAQVKVSRVKRMTEDEEKMFGIEKLNVVRSDIPAVTHVDYSARIQTVEKERNGLFYELISEFNKLTGCAVIINTSFNVRGEPIVNTPQDAFRCFMGTELDVLVIGDCYLLKEEQDTALLKSYKDEFELD